MNVNELLIETFGRIRGAVHAAVDGLSPDDLAVRPDDVGNSIGWLIWHLSRIQDDHLAGAAGTDQLWTTAGWAERFALPMPVTDTGFGHSESQVDQVRTTAELLDGYHDAVHERTVDYLGALEAGDYDDVIDRSWDPPVTRGVRLISVVGDCMQHVGQAAYVRGFVLGR